MGIRTQPKCTPPVTPERAPSFHSRSGYTTGHSVSSASTPERLWGSPRSCSRSRCHGIGPGFWCGAASPSPQEQEQVTEVLSMFGRHLTYNHMLCCIFPSLELFPICLNYLLNQDLVSTGFLTCDKINKIYISPHWPLISGHNNSLRVWLIASKWALEELSVGAFWIPYSLSLLYSCFTIAVPYKPW